MRVGDPPIGGRYAIVRAFGEDERFAGGRVQTWRGRDTLVDRDVVLRVLTPGGNTARLFLDRALEMSLIAHPGLGMVYEAVDLGEFALVVSEWISGVSLAETIQAHGPLTPATARETLGEVADAITEAHRAGLPIGGITADRVVLRGDASVAITGVPALFADERGDIMQLGALLYAALTGAQPDPDQPDLARHLHRQIPRDLATLCERALDPDPTTQLGSAAAFAAVMRPRARRPATPDLSEPDAASAAPGTTGPGTTEPGTTGPGTTEPGTTGPGTTGPGTTGPGTTVPGTGEPGTTVPAAAVPGTGVPAPASPPAPASSPAKPQTAGRVGQRVRDLDPAAATPTRDTGPTVGLPRSGKSSGATTSPRAQALPALLSPPVPAAGRASPQVEAGGTGGAGGGADAAGTSRAARVSSTVGTSGTPGAGSTAGTSSTPGAGSTAGTSSTAGVGSAAGVDSAAGTVGTATEGRPYGSSRASGAGSTGAADHPDAAADPALSGGAAATDLTHDDAGTHDRPATSRLGSARVVALGGAAAAAGAAAFGALARLVRRRERRADSDFDERDDPEGPVGTGDEIRPGDESRGFHLGAAGDQPASGSDAGFPRAGSGTEADDWADDYAPWEDDDGTWGQGWDDEDDAADESGQTRRKVLLYAVPLVALLLVVALGIIVGNQFSDVATVGGEDPAASQDAGQTSAEPTDANSTETAVAPVALAPVGAAVFDPFGDGEPENDQDVPLAFDGDIGSVWQTLTYQGSPEFGGLKPGVGIIFDLGQERTLNSVELATSLPGSAIEVRVGAAPDAALESYPVAGTLDPFPDSGSVALAEPARARYVIIWFVRLVEDGGGFRANLAECRFLGT